MQTRVHILAEGLVQGVGFRWFVARKAEALGVTGWVRNLYNGNVEVEAEASRPLLEELISHIRVGPRSAHVTSVHIEWMDNCPQQYTRFEIH